MQGELPNLYKSNSPFPLNAGCNIKLKKMKKTITYFSCFVLFVSSGCSKYLEKEPDNRAKLSSPAKVSQLLGTAYPQANYMVFNEAMSDNSTDKGSGELDNTNLDPYFFNDVRDNDQDSPEFYWFACYTAIAAANQALDACLKAPDPENYSAQKGEALLARAYAHFMLVTLYAKTYDPATAQTDPGIPYVTEPENVVIKQYDRKTVAYVYEMLEKDILEGLPLIDDKTYTVPRYHFNQAAANAFAARFFLYKKDYARTVQYATASVPDFLQNLRPWNTTYAALGLNDLPITYAKSTENANLLLIETPSWWARLYAKARYGLNPFIQNEVFQSPVPVTGGIWSFRTGTIGGISNVAVPKINEYFVRTSINAQIGTGYIMVPALTVEEVLFNKAEANAYLNNFTAAINDLNTYASTRITNYNAATHAITMARLNSYYGSANTSENLIKLILNYKRAEFVQEGMRWFDILRYKIPVVHQTVQGQTITLSPDDPRRLLQLPESASLSGISQNPR
jgi:hypothetical protein